MTVKHFNKKRRRRHIACPVKGCKRSMYRTNTTGVCGGCQSKFGCKLCGWVDRRYPVVGRCSRCVERVKLTSADNRTEMRSDVAREQRAMRLGELIRRGQEGKELFDTIANAREQRAG